MRKLILALAICLGSAGFAVAGPGHDHEHEHSHSHGPITSDDAGKKAIKKVTQLAKAGKIDASWLELKPASITQKTYANGPEWVVTFKNSKVSDASKQTLYLFYSLDGHYIAANYTGE